MTELTISPDLDCKALAAQFAAQRWVQIPGFLADDGADVLLDHIASREDWMRTWNEGGETRDVSRDLFDAWPEDKRRAYEDLSTADARDGFQYRFENIRVPEIAEKRARRTDPLTSFVKLMSGKALDLLRAIMDDETVNFADGQAVAYARGDFLTGHHDDIDGKNRRAAYVFNMTREWRAEWGGLLLFHGDDGHISRGLVPMFNVLNIFAVPQHHSVSEVTRAAGDARRYSVTGWLRAE